MQVLLCLHLLDALCFACGFVVVHTLLVGISLGVDVRVWSPTAKRMRLRRFDSPRDSEPVEVGHKPESREVFVCKCALCFDLLCDQHHIKNKHGCWTP